MKCIISIGLAAGGVAGMLRVLEHGVADDFQETRADLDVVPDAPAGGQFVGGAGFDVAAMAGDAGPVKRAAVGDDGNHSRHLQRGDDDFLADADIGLAAPAEGFARVFGAGEMRGGFLGAVDVGLFAQMETPGYGEDFSQAGLAAIMDEVSVAGEVNGALKIEWPRPGGVSDRPGVRRGAIFAGAVENFVGIKTVLQAGETGDDLERRARRIGTGDGPIERRPQRRML